MNIFSGLKDKYESKILSKWNHLSLSKLSVTDSELNEMALDLSNKFTYSQLKNERAEVIGYLRDTVNTRTRAFLHNYVLEKACNILKKDWKPEIVRSLELDLSKYTPVPVELLDEVNLVDYPLQYFKKMIVLSPTEGLVDSLKIIQNDTIFYEGYKLTGTRAIGETILFAWVLPDVPMLLLAYSPVIAQPFCEIKKHIENAADQFKEIYTRYIFEQNEQVNNYKYMLVEKEQEVKVTAKRAEDYKADKEFLLRQQNLVPGEEDPSKITIGKPIYYGMAVLSMLCFVFLALIVGK